MPKAFNFYTCLASIARVAVRLLRAVAAVTGPTPLCTLAAGLGYCSSFLFSRERRIAEAQIALVQRSVPAAAAHGFFQGSPEAASRKVFAHVARAFVEALLIPVLLKDIDQYVESEGQEMVNELLKQGEGAVCLSGHLGCFEMLAAFHVAKGVPLSVIGRYPKIGSLGEALSDLRRGYGIEMVWRENRTSGRKLYASLQEGRFLAALIDQDTKLDNRYSNFLGIPAAYPIMPIRLALRSKRPILASFIVRLSAKRHRVITRKFEYDANSASAEQDVLDQFNALFENLVLQYPEQWIWWHRRWRRRPGVDYRTAPEQLRGTAAYLQWLKQNGPSD